MSSKSNPSQPASGAPHLKRRSRLIRSQDGLRRLDDILVVEDEPRDSDRIIATLRVLVGYDELVVRTASTISSAVDAVLEQHPKLVLLDDALKPSDTATDTIPFLQRAGYDGPIVVISGQVTRRRRTELLQAGAVDVIHKDDVDSVQLSACLLRVFPDLAIGASDGDQAGEAKGEEQ